MILSNVWLNVSGTLEYFIHLLMRSLNNRQKKSGFSLAGLKLCVDVNACLEVSRPDKHFNIFSSDINYWISFSHVLNLGDLIRDVSIIVNVISYVLYLIKHKVSSVCIYRALAIVSWFN